ncbi:hypothetical protein ACSX1A_16045 [Pontibacter sp. MBLB2868]|uniref:hypothetical protein n=1 Tax=Pontibacter sp. MBLB2868 TaxID=3451555 RepID=UPI003F74E1F5
MRKKNVIAAAFALYGLTIVTDVQAQSGARQNAPPGQKKLAKQIKGKQQILSIAASTFKNRKINNQQVSIC